MKILANARIRTLDPRLPQASALAIENGRIRLVGSLEQVQQAANPGTEWIDMGGKSILPGLTDSHLHLEHYALGLQRVDCETPSRLECQQRVQQKVDRTLHGAWVRGHGWNQNQWGGDFGSAADLDDVAPENPVYLTAKSLHAAWVNSRALMLAGISAATPDPPGGKIARDHHGKPTGILFEAAMQLVESVIPAANETQVSAAILEAQNKLFRFGVTGVHDFDQRLCFAVLQKLHAEGNLRMRVVKSVPLPHLEHALALGVRTGFGDDTLRLGSVKIFSDGALGPRTAAMLEAYENSPAEERGMLLESRDHIIEIGQTAIRNGLSLAIHAIGDRANREVLDAFEQLRAFEQKERLPPLRHRIEHVQVLHPDDLHRLAQLNLIASVQPIHATSDMEMAEKHWGKRAAFAYAFKSLLKHGTLLIFGSDAPVESPNPFWGIHAAVTRQRHDGTPHEEGWNPAQRLTLPEALFAFTTAPAIAAGVEQHLGRLSVGCYADLIVLEQDLFEITAHEIKDVRPLATMVGGEWVWQS